MRDQSITRDTVFAYMQGTGKGKEIPFKESRNSSYSYSVHCIRFFLGTRSQDSGTDFLTRQIVCWLKGCLLQADAMQANLDLRFQQVLETTPQGE